MKFSQSIHLLMCLSLKNLTSIIRTGLHNLVELIELVNYVIIFLSQMTLLRWLNFLLGSLTVILTVLLFWIYFFFLTLVFFLQWLSLLPPINSKRDVSFYHIAYDYCRDDWDGLLDHLKDVLWEDIFKLSASAAASKFCRWVQIVTEVSGLASFISMVSSCLCCCHDL